MTILKSAQISSRNQMHTNYEVLSTEEKHPIKCNWKKLFDITEKKSLSMDYFDFKGTQTYV